jgi:hypothetical protein
MTRALILSEVEVAAIREAFAKACAKPISTKEFMALVVPQQNVDVLTLDNRAPGQENVRPPSHQVLIPHGYRMAISVEEQPAGMVGHFSFSVEAAGKTPNPVAVEMLLAVLGFELRDANAQWVEEFLIDDKSGGLAVNLLFVLNDSQRERRQHEPSFPRPVLPSSLKH